MWIKYKKENNLNFDLNELVKLSYLNHNSYEKIFPKHWENFKLIYKTNGKILSFANILVIKKFFFKLIYIPGGIEGEFDKDILESFLVFLKKNYDFFSIIFVNFHQEDSFNHFIPKNFTKIINLHETRMIMIKNLDNSDLLKKNYSKNWRHNLNRSKKFSYNLSINHKPDIDELLNLYKEMSKLKNFNIYITRSYLKTLFINLKEKLIHLECRVGGRLIAFRTCLYHSGFAWDLLACSNELSKKNYCTYAILHNIFLFLIEKNIRTFDFSGVDKKNNIGVYNFKKGAGSQEYIKIGEYAYSQNFLIKYFFILFIFCKRLFIK